MAKHKCQVALEGLRKENGEKRAEVRKAMPGASPARRKRLKLRLKRHDEIDSALTTLQKQYLLMDECVGWDSGA